ncbi:hypothetical protein BB559_004557 [Furculomyces boomerangus]|uniref:Uncharacterized protein n=2 Tax=Harpellales TaxID=61421 RepID=A0A2T9YE46_9FUNG|nr:hypothetical protein BB559_004557 [Furculomyces boomerangus]PWA01411.1 hypothetical protein BB558_002495 [Smittium angustum]
MFFKGPKLSVMKVVQGKNISNHSDPKSVENEFEGWTGPHFPEVGEEKKHEYNDYDLFVYWRFEGLSWGMNLLGRPESGTVYNGLFLYKFNNEGLINAHIVVSISPPPKSMFLTRFWNQWSTFLTPKDTRLGLGCTDHSKT